MRCMSRPQHEARLEHGRQDRLQQVDSEAKTQQAGIGIADAPQVASLVPKPRKMYQPVAQQVLTACCVQLAAAAGLIPCY